MIVPSIFFRCWKKQKKKKNEIKEFTTPVTGQALGPISARRKSCKSGAVPNRRRRYKVIDLFRVSTSLGRRRKVLFLSGLTGRLSLSHRLISFLSSSFYSIDDPLHKKKKTKLETKTDDSSTTSKKTFRRKYTSITHRMVHRKSSVEMFRRLATSTFGKTVVLCLII